MKERSVSRRDFLRGAGAVGAPNRSALTWTALARPPISGRPCSTRVPTASSSRRSRSLPPPTACRP
ncbi:twin-arginine translocation signal domain-containing protein [Adlercreutzia caecimuris]|uniref:Twin-arginine translocation signal domain-containing protein n=1 Tax=Adlercreutzia caecimuris TaxID=671266 RepID=A0A4S4FZS7_9ACTN|nr:twin-arginine translocation signal domain-containing protein [Adlercreutzia caecimuris]